MPWLHPRMVLVKVCHSGVLLIHQLACSKNAQGRHAMKLQRAQILKKRCFHLGLFPNGVPNTARLLGVRNIVATLLSALPHHLRQLAPKHSSSGAETLAAGSFPTSLGRPGL